jgi:hypothetical protein
MAATGLEHIGQNSSMFALARSHPRLAHAAVNKSDPRGKRAAEHDAHRIRCTVSYAEQYSTALSTSSYMVDRAREGAMMFWRRCREEEVRWNAPVFLAALESVIISMMLYRVHEIEIPSSRR